MREKIVDLGGSSNPESVGKRCTVADIKAGRRFYRVMIDCGTEFFRQGGTDTMSVGPDFSFLNDREVDAVVLTHADADHAGALGLLIKSGMLKKDAPIVSTPQTAGLLEFVMGDGEKSGNHSFLESIDVMSRRRAVLKPGLCEVLPGLPVFFDPAGHKPGAVALGIPIRSGKGVALISGDRSSPKEDRPTVKGPSLISETWPRDLASKICQVWSTDLTYGSKPKNPLSGEVERMQLQLEADILAGKKSVYGAFGSERGQAVAMWLLPVAQKYGVPIWLDGSISKIWDIFKDNPWSDKDLPLPELGENTGIMRIRDSMHREALLRKDGPAIFVTTPGMFDHRPMVKYLEHGLSREDFSFIITSWFAPGTNADRLWSAWGKIQKARQSGNNEEFTVKIHDDEAGWQRLAFRAQLHRFGLGAHGDLNDFVEFIEDIVKVCRGGKLFEFMVLGHGSHESQQDAAQRLRQFSEQMFFSQDKLTINVG